MSSHLPHSELYDYIKKNGPPDSWQNTETLQACYTLEEKGWKVKVAFKQCQYGLGVFADQDITKGTVLRTMESGKTLIIFYENDVNNFSDNAIKYISHFAHSVIDETDPNLNNHIFKNSVQLCIPGVNMNHSVDNNCRWGYDESGKGISCIIATSDIKCGDELLNDYNEFGGGQAPAWYAKLIREKGLNGVFKDLSNFY